MELIHNDAENYMESIALEKRPNVVYLDPMFPVRAKTAQVKKEMQVFHQLLGAENLEVSRLMDSALRYFGKPIPAANSGCW